MRIAHINTTADGVAAPSRIMLSLVRETLGAGHDVMVVYGRGRAPNGVESMRVGSDFDVVMHYAMGRINDSEGLNSLGATRRMLRRLREWGPDIVHLHNLHGHYLHVPFLLEGLANMHIPVMATLHDCWLLTGHCAFYSHTSCTPENCGAGRCKLKREYPATLFGSARRNLDIKKRHLRSLGSQLHLVAPSKLIAEHARLYLSDLQPRVSVIPNGIDLSMAVLSGEEGDHLHGEAIAIAAKWELRKNLDALLAIVPSLGRELRIAGNMSGSSRLPDGVESVGCITSADALAQFYSSGSVLINPSAAETFGMTTVEALACGTPVVVNRACATAEVLSNPGADEVGMAVDFSSAQEVARAVERVSTFSSIKCRQYAQRYFSDTLMAQRYIELYRSIL